MTFYYKNCEITNKTANAIEEFNIGIAEAIATGTAYLDTARAKIDAVKVLAEQQFSVFTGNMEDAGIKKGTLCDPCSGFTCDEQLLLAGVAQIGPKLFLVEGNNFKNLSVAVQALGANALLAGMLTSSDMIIGYAVRDTATDCEAMVSWTNVAGESYYSSVLESNPDAVLFTVWLKRGVSRHAHSRLLALGVPDQIITAALARSSTAQVQSFQTESPALLLQLMSLGISSEQIEAAAKLGISGIKLESTYAEVQGRLQIAASSIGIHVNGCGNLQFSNIFNCLLNTDYDAAFGFTSNTSDCMDVFSEMVKDALTSQEVKDLFAFFDTVNNGALAAVQFLQQVRSAFLGAMTVISQLESMLWGFIGDAASKAGEDWVKGFGTSLLKCLLGQLKDIDFFKTQQEKMDEWQKKLTKILSDHVFSYFDLILGGLDEAVEFIEGIFKYLMLPTCITTSTITKLIGVGVGPADCVASFDFNALDLTIPNCIIDSFRKLLQFIIDIVTSIRQIIQNIRLFIVVLRSLLFDIDLSFEGHNICNPSAADKIVEGIHGIIADMRGDNEAVTATSQLEAFKAAVTIVTE